MPTFSLIVEPFMGTDKKDEADVISFQYDVSRPMRASGERELHGPNIAQASGESVSLVRIIL